jgi:putative ABC transport system permease protein
VTSAWLRIARRELAGGVGGFWIYLACLALGAWAIAAAGSVTHTFSAGLDIQSRRLLGGDAGLSLSQREATPDELAWMRARGTVSETVSTDLMARNGQQVRQTDVRGVDGAFPLIGQPELAPAMPLAQALEQREGVWGAAVSQTLLDALQARVGDRIDLGGRPFQIRAVLVAEPDRIGTPGSFQPSALVSLDALREGGDLAPGRLFRAGYRLLLNPATDAAAFEADADAAWGEAGMRYRAPEDAVDGLRDLLDMLNTFMSVVGIAALVAGGVGVSQATSAFLETRVESIAALKALGAEGGTIRAAYGAQFGALAVLGALAGVLAGAATPILLIAIAGDRIPLPAQLSLYPLPLVIALVLALLAAVVFAAPALGRARLTPPAALFRREGDETAARRPVPELLTAALAAVALIVLAMLGSARPVVTLGLLVGAAFAWLVLHGAARLVKRAARAAASGARGYARLVLSSLGGPGSLAPVVAPALGLGIALLTLVAVVETNLVGQVRDTAPANAPAVIFRQIPGGEEAAAFDALMARQGVEVSDPDQYRRAPFILGRVIALKGQPLREEDVAPEERWVTRGETGMTIIGEQPPEADLRAGKWWPADYSGPLLVSVEEGAAKGLGLSVGDSIGFRIFGRELDAKVASIRRVDWGGFGANMAFVLSPGALEAAKPFSTAIVRIAPEKEDALVRAVADRWPGVLAFQLRRTLETAASLLDQITLIVSLLAGVVTLAGVLVLFGAFAAAIRRRRTETALLKVFGAERARIMGLYAAEFGLAGLVAVLAGCAMGIAAAYPVVIQVFEARWRFDPAPIAGVALVAIGASAAGGAFVGWRTLAQRPAAVLRST